MASSRASPTRESSKSVARRVSTAAVSSSPDGGRGTDSLSQAAGSASRWSAARSVTIDSIASSRPVVVVPPDSCTMSVARSFAGESPGSSPDGPAASASEIVRWIARRRWMARSASVPIDQAGGSPSSKRAASAQVTKNESSVPTASRSTFDVTRTRRSRKNAASAAGRSIAAASDPVASGEEGSAALASRWRTRARISPAAFRAKVAAKMSSMSAPSARRRMSLVERAWVLPVPALASTRTIGSSGVMAGAGSVGDWGAAGPESARSRVPPARPERPR